MQLFVPIWAAVPKRNLTRICRKQTGARNPESARWYSLPTILFLARRSSNAVNWCYIEQEANGDRAIFERAVVNVLTGRSGFQQWANIFQLLPTRSKTAVHLPGIFMLLPLGIFRSFVKVPMPNAVSPITST